MQRVGFQLGDEALIAALVSFGNRSIVERRSLR